MPLVHALDLDAVWPDAHHALLRFAEVDQAATVALELVVVRQILGSRKHPIVANHAILKVLFGVNEPGGMPSANDGLILNAPRLGWVGLLVLQMHLPAGEILAVEDRRE